MMDGEGYIISTGCAFMIDGPSGEKFFLYEDSSLKYFSLGMVERVVPV